MNSPNGTARIETLLRRPDQAQITVLPPSARPFSPDPLCIAILKCRMAGAQVLEVVKPAKILVVELSDRVGHSLYSR